MNADACLLQAYRRSLQQINAASLTSKWAQQQTIARPIHLLAVGKCAAAMARGAADVFGAQIVANVVVTQRGNASPCPFAVRYASHPVLDESSLQAGEHVLQFVRAVPADDCLLVLLSGGASALMEVLPESVSLADYQNIVRYLLAHHYDIHAINAVRQQLSLLKGGRLLQACHQQTQIEHVLISDVPGDQLASIGSGPFVAASATLPPLPEWITAHFASPSPMLDVARVSHHVLANNAHWLHAFAQQTNLAPVVSQTLSGDVLTMASACADTVLNGPPGLYVWGGECTVQLPVDAKPGGRMQHFALAFLQKPLPATVSVLAASSDGIDGNSDAAGVLLSASRINDLRQQTLALAQALSSASSYAFWQCRGGQLFCSATETNVMDLVAVIKE